MGKEFKNKIDFCAEANVRFPVKDFVIVDSKLYPPVFIMVGPVPISFGEYKYQKLFKAMQFLLFIVTRVLQYFYRS